MNNGIATEIKSGAGDERFVDKLIIDIKPIKLKMNRFVIPSWLKSKYSLLTKYKVRTEKRVKLTFLINFDEKLWVGCLWKMDQSPLQEYQPQGWSALEDKVLDYLPSNLKGYFV